MQRPEFSPTEFFARQDAARSRTGRLVLWFALAVLGTAAAVYGAALLCFGAIGSQGRHHAAPVVWSPSLFFGCLGATLLIVGGASLFRSMQLGGGGGKVAESVGGRRVAPDTRHEDERRLLNIVEEMGIASGVPVPAVYVLDHEAGINAFAAGDSIENAAIAVTQGALDKLSRDELQAVIGHEFSHILNGDMRLNLRLIGWIFGLLALTIVGRVILEVSPRSRSSDREKGNLGAALMLFGLLVLLIGFVANFFAQLIQASISRQREHLADASSSQFTRNPEALADALRRIAGDSVDTKLRDPHASEVAHMCFATGVAAAFATHPPIEERIRLLKPDWDGSFLPPLDPGHVDFADEERVARARANASSAFAENLRRASGSPVAAPAAPFSPGPELATLLRTPAGARVAMMLLIMSDNPADNNAQAAKLKGLVEPEVFSLLKNSWTLLRDVPPRARLGVVQFAAPALRESTRAESGELIRLLRELARNDGAVSLFEIALIRFVAAITHPADDSAEERSLVKLKPALRLVLGALAGASGADRESASAALETVMNLAPAFGVIDGLPDDGELSAEAIEEAFVTLASADFARRRQVMSVAEALVKQDGVITDTESDLLRALAAALRCPTNLA